MNLPTITPAHQELARRVLMTVIDQASLLDVSIATHLIAEAESKALAEAQETIQELRRKLAEFDEKSQVNANLYAAIERNRVFLAESEDGWMKCRAAVVEAERGFNLIYEAACDKRNDEVILTAGAHIAKMNKALNLKAP